MVELETTLRRVALWARRGMPHTRLLAGTDGLLRFRPERGDLAARMPSGDEVRVQLDPTGRRITITRTGSGFDLAGSADIPPHLLERGR
jgi:hypothetical protein